MRQARQRSSKLICRFDVTAFAAALFVLVAMFLLPAAIVMDTPRNAARMPVEQVKASHAVALWGAMREDALLIAVGRNNHIWFDTRIVTAGDLTSKIRDRLNHGAERKVYIRADLRARYRTVLAILDSVRATGIDNIAFVVDDRKSLLAHQ
jgi:biopolymer transport protein ExbD